MSNCLILLLFWVIGEGSISQPGSGGKDLTCYQSGLKLIQQLITINSCSVFYDLVSECRRI